MRAINTASHLAGGGFPGSGTHPLQMGQKDAVISYAVAVTQLAVTQLAVQA